MAECNSHANNQKKRRLPEWMSRTSSSSEEKQTEDANELPQPHPVLSLETTVSVAFTGKEKELEPKKKTRTSHKNVLDTAVGYSKKSGLQRPSKVTSKTVGKGKKRDRTSETKDGNKECGDMSSHGNEDGLELTVDDLISIARVYVKADEEAKRVERGSKRSTSRPSSSPDFQRGSDGVSDIEASESTTISRGPGIMPESEGNDSDHLDLGSTATGLSRTVDAAQDMLDVFFGSLLKKARPENQKPKTVLENNMVWNSSHTDEHAYSQTGLFSDPLVGKPDLRDWQSEIAAIDVDWSFATSSKQAVTMVDRRSEMVVIEKKKSSLKEKVTMLLD